MAKKRKSRVHPLTWWDRARISFFRKLGSWSENYAAGIEIGFYNQSEGARPKDLYDEMLCPLCEGRIVHDYFMHGICEFFDCSYQYDFDEITQALPLYHKEQLQPLNFAKWKASYCIDLNETQLADISFNEGIYY